MASRSSIFRNTTSLKMTFYEKPHLDMLWHSMDLKTVPKKDRMWQLHDPWGCFKGHPRDNPLLLPHDVKLQLEETGNWIYEKLGASQIKESKEDKKSKEKTCADHSLLFSSRQCRGRNMCTLTFSCLVFSRLYLSARGAKRTSMSLHQKVHFCAQEMQILQSIPFDEGLPAKAGQETSLVSLSAGSFVHRFKWKITSASGEQDLAQKSHSAIHKINFIN